MASTSSLASAMLRRIQTRRPQMIIGICSLVFGSLGLESPAWSFEPDWSIGHPGSPQGEINPYQLSPFEFETAKQNGRLHTLVYPVSVSGAWMPWKPFVRLMDGTDGNPWTDFVRSLVQRAFGFSSSDAMLDWVGLKPYPEVTDSGVYAVPYPLDPKTGRRERPVYRMGATLSELSLAQGVRGLGFTVSCAGCHAGELFGKRVLGLTNRFPKANEFFLKGQSWTQQMDGGLFQLATTASVGERAMFERLKVNARAIGARAPLVEGLDTSLAQVALSLAKRNADPVASKNPALEKTPRPERLNSAPADSKPSVWWTAKYKNRWLSDGSVVSGNPVYTNFLWNEIGRGADLSELEVWLDQNPKVLQELTTAVMASQAPRWTDFFDAAQVSLPRARRGQELFDQRCSGCHGTYEKAWESLSESEIANRPATADLLLTTRVSYLEQTPVVDVGTDPMRALGMSSLAAGLNPLSISKKSGTWIEPQTGYVAPPLEGIWARWPYFHNNSAPSLCAVLTRGDQRPVSYWAGEAVDRNADFDSDCVGYPSDSKVPALWKTFPGRFYDSKRVGLSNRGHDEGIFLKQGRELLSPDQKRDLIEYLKTL